MSDRTAISTGGTTSVGASEASSWHRPDLDEPSSWSSPGWRRFLTQVASGLVAATGPADRVLDVGCGTGLLTRAFVAAGSQGAEGLEISRSLVDRADPEVKGRLRVGSVTAPITGRYDLVTCLEVLQHLSPSEAATAIDNLCAVTDRLVLSSDPGDFDQPAPVFVRSVADWAAELAARGFFRRTDVDLSFLSPWAVFFERHALTTRDVVHRYESALWSLREEVVARRAAQHDLHRQLGQAEDGETVARLRHEILVLRDHAIGSEAAVGTARADLARARAEAEAARADQAHAEGQVGAARAEQTRVEADLARTGAELARTEAELRHARDQLDDSVRRLNEVVESNRWRVGGALLAPLASVKRRVRR